ncbi:MAG: amidase [Candidatus Binatia bacterium]|nr:amidase [Candidatus Binatia bacterium]
MKEVLYRPLTEIIRRLQTKEISPVELMRTTLDRIRETQPTLNSFCQIGDDDQLLAGAKAAEERIGRGEGGALEGIPLGVKELEDALGFRSTHASVPYKNNMPAQDSTQVERLKAAGAIVVGKTNAPEFGYTAISKNLLFGVSRSPWNPDHTPGGSSGGSSAAIAGGVLPLATASDGGGSVRIPASFTGCFGLKVSYGRVPHGPEDLWVMDDTAVHGPLTRTVEDAAIHLDAVVGAHPLDPKSLPHPGFSYREILKDLPKKLRIAYSPDLGYAVVQSDIAAGVADAARVFEELGHTVEEIKGGPPEPGYAWGISGAFEMLAKLAPLLPEHEEEFGRGFINGVKAGAKMTPDIWRQLRDHREQLNRWCAQTFSDYDLLLTPTVPFDAPPARGPFPAETEGRKQPMATVGSFTMPFNLSWHPAATVRAGISKAGLPIGLQIVAPRHRDDLAMQASWAYEQARPWAHEWPTV